MAIHHKLVLFLWMALVFCLTGCEEEPVPVIPDPDPDLPIDFVPNPNLFQLKVSQTLLCSGDQTDIVLTDYENKPKERSNYNFYIFPEIGTLDLESGFYQAPENLDQEIFVELWAESKANTSIKSGQLLRLQPQIPGSRVLTHFNGVSEAVDSKLLPDGSMIFASNNPADPPGLLTTTEFEVFCTDQEGNLLWNTQLGKGTLRRLYVGKEAIYGLGHLKSVGFVAVKFDFEGNHLATKNLEIEFAMNTSLLENLKGSFDDEGEFFIGYGVNSLRMMMKLDSGMNLSSAKPIPALGSDFYSLENSKFLITSQPLNAGFVVTDSELKVLWEKTYGSEAMNITRAIKSETGMEIWSMIREYSSNSVLLKTFDLTGNPILDKTLSFPDHFNFGPFHDIVQLPNGEIWFVGSSQFFSSTNPLFKDKSMANSYHLIQFSPKGEIIKETTLGHLGLPSPPSFPGGWRFHYQGMFQGQNGLMLTGQWFYNFLIQLSPDYRFSSCPL